MSERRITKVRYKGGKVEIHEVEAGDGETERTTEMIHRCAEDPAQSFVDAFKALTKHVGAIMEWPPGYAEGQLEVRSVSFSMSKNDVEGAVISGIVKLTKADGAWSWNTPHMPFEPYGDGGGQSTMPGDAVQAVELVRAEGRKYLGGERAQPGLFDGKMAAAGEKRPEAEFV